MNYASFQLYLLVPSATATRSATQPTSTILRSTITLLVSCSCSRPTKLLRLAPSVVRHQQCPIVLHQSLLQLILRMLIDVFLVVCHYRLGDCLTDSIDLRCVTAARDAYPNVNIGEFVDTNDEEGLIDFKAKDLGLDEREWSSVDFDEAFASFTVCNGGCSLLLAEALYHLRG